MDSKKKASKKDIKEMRAIMREMIDEIIHLEEDSSSEEQEQKKRSDKSTKQIPIIR